MLECPCECVCACKRLRLRLRLCVSACLRLYLCICFVCIHMCICGCICVCAQLREVVWLCALQSVYTRCNKRTRMHIHPNMRCYDHTAKLIKVSPWPPARLKILQHACCKYFFWSHSSFVAVKGQVVPLRRLKGTTGVISIHAYYVPSNTLEPRDRHKLIYTVVCFHHLEKLPTLYSEKSPS
jgi:hypothetical protein